MLRERLERRGFETSSKEVYHATLSGARTLEKRLVAYSREKGVKITYSEFSDGRRRLSILIRGSGATRDKEERLLELGWKVDLEDGERLYAVREVKSQERVEEIIDEILGSARP